MRHEPPRAQSRHQSAEIDLRNGENREQEREDKNYRYEYFRFALAIQQKYRTTGQQQHSQIHQWQPRITDKLEHGIAAGNGVIAALKQCIALLCQWIIDRDLFLFAINQQRTGKLAGALAVIVIVYSELFKGDFKWQGQ